MNRDQPLIEKPPTLNKRPGALQSPSHSDLRERYHTRAGQGKQGSL
jgi:hypothetical protein